MVIGPMVTPYNPERLSKAERAYLAVGMLYEGNIWVPGRKTEDGLRSDVFAEVWAEAGITAGANFTGKDGEADDEADSVTQAIRFYRTRRDLVSSTDERDDSEDRERRGDNIQIHRAPLYG